jgi:hypothetical protein
MADDCAVRLMMVDALMTTGIRTDGQLPIMVKAEQ